MTPWSHSDSEQSAAWLGEGNRIEYLDGVSNDDESFSELADAIGLNISRGVSSRNIIPHHLTSSSDLFCNREINMEQLEAIGFDMDWTLAQYNEDFDLLAFNGAKQKLVSMLGYPEEVLMMHYSQNSCRRGCLIDKKRGNLIKLDQHNYVRNAEHGLTPLTRDERQDTYRNHYHEMQAFNGEDFVNIDTPFSLVDACLFSHLVQLKDKLDEELENKSPMADTKYSKLWSDLRKCVDQCHKDGVIKKTVEKNPEKYITYDPNIFPMLESFRKNGRKVFLLTNSLWDYTQVVMNYLQAKKVGDDVDMKWTEYFDLIIVAGNKPGFLVDDRGALPLFRVDTTTLPESLSNVEMIPSLPSQVEAFLEEGKIFQGGNAQYLHKMLSLKSGDRLLYVGDHVYSDVLRSKRTLGWRTCLIIPELTNEIMVHKRESAPRNKLVEMRKLQFNMEKELDQLVSADNEVVDFDDRSNSDMINEVNILRKKIKDKLVRYNRSYHPRWGPLFKAGFQESRFAKQICDYACLYTSRASNLGLVAPVRPFRPTRDLLPHEAWLEMANPNRGEDDETN
jgi:5'-nucleotidase